ncbi:MAG: hypothetical protein ORN49_09215, partial [Rhodobacteraceae bacterium]|nr:hypothetical protein [Paracoccaceae bacterium]
STDARLSAECASIINALRSAEFTDDFDATHDLVRQVKRSYDAYRLIEGMKAAGLQAFVHDPQTGAAAEIDLDCPWPKPGLQDSREVDSLGNNFVCA